MEKTLNHKGTQTVETDRLIFRKFIMEDAPFMYHNWSNDADAIRYLSWHAHKNQVESETLIQNLIGQYKNSTIYTWAIVVKENIEPIGYINIHALHDYHKRGEISYCIGRNFWNNGYATEAVKSIVSYMFFDIELNRIIGLHDVLNPASGRVLEKAGFKYEGLLRQHEIDKNGRAQDLNIYAITKDDIQ